MPKKKQSLDSTQTATFSPVDSGNSIPITITEEPSAKIVKERVSIPLAADGSLDIGAMRSGSKDRLLKALAANPEAFQAFGVGKVDPSSVAVEDGPITEDQAEFLLNGYEWVTRKYVPVAVARQTKGQCIISPEIADVAFRFDAKKREKIIPLTAEVLNKQVVPHLPPWLLKILSKGGPLAELGMLVVGGTMMQTKTAIDMWKDEQQRIPQAVPAEPASVN